MAPEFPQEGYFMKIKVSVFEVSSTIAFVLLGLGSANASNVVPWTITATGVITSDGPGVPDQLGLFGTPGVSLIGDTYTETIITNPLLNTYFTVTTKSLITTYGGGNWSAGTGAPYTIVTTVNGVTNTQTGSDPFVNYAYLLDTLKPPMPSPQDQAYQQIKSEGCASSYGSCTLSYILAYSLTDHFVKNLDFSKPFTVSAGLDPGSNNLFSVREGPLNSEQQYTTFTGSITSLSVNARENTLSVNTLERVSTIPLPGAFPLLASGLAGLALFSGWRRMRPSARLETSHTT
jgi:hypothetical protein